MTSPQRGTAIRPSTKLEVEAQSGGSLGGGVDAKEVEPEEVAEETFECVDCEDTNAKVLPRPSMKEVEAHNCTHLPYRNWCPVEGP